MAKYLFQVVLTGSQLFGRAFARAIREEIQASQEAARRMGHQPRTKDFAMNAKMGMTVDEAKRILDINALTPEDVSERYKFLFAANDSKKGGSFYILSKIVRAKERLDQELKQNR